MTNSLYLKPFRLIRATFLIKCATVEAATFAGDMQVMPEREREHTMYRAANDGYR
ncbi:hypothetical protein [Porphyrobacter sp. AAP82]|uniref:hypothetical protein n=1 Tax=Porphyrobacter sp. AAP82 TaxID=1248917 RepID=UPI0018C8C5F0|nr:hypothetical protein [Porphyrobacter sp. AAP82]